MCTRVCLCLKKTTYMKLILNFSFIHGFYQQILREKNIFKVRIDVSIYLSINAWPFFSIWLSIYLSISACSYLSNMLVYFRLFVSFSPLISIYQSISTCSYISIYLSAISYIIIIIIMSRFQYGYPWPSVATPPYRPLLPATSLYAFSSWSSYLCTSMWRGPQEYITYELVPTSPAVSCMSGLSN